MNKISCLFFLSLVIFILPTKIYSQNLIEVNFSYRITYYKVNITTPNTTINYTPQYVFISELTLKKRRPRITNFRGGINFINRNNKRK